MNNKIYELCWLGKEQVKAQIEAPLKTVLEEDKEFNSKEENLNSQNLLIQGDNLEVLKHLLKDYKEKIKMIYIDPPYNTKSKDLLYNDNRKHSLEELKEIFGDSFKEAKQVLKTIGTESLFHSAWLSFMYPRLFLAKQLLRDDGVIFVSIDDNEVAQLKLIMDEIYGEENFVGIVPRKTKGSVVVQSDSNLQKINDFLIIYFKNKRIGKFNLKKVGEKKYPFEDEKGKYNLISLQDIGKNGFKEARPNLWYPIYQLSDGSLSLEKIEEKAVEILPEKKQGKDGCWMWSKKKFNENKQDLIVVDGKVYIKKYFDINEDQNKYQKEKMFLDNFYNAEGTKRFNELFCNKGFFDNPKPTSLIKWCINLATEVYNNDIILDFFAGSGTTGDAVMQINAEDGGNRKYILVQLDEPVDPQRDKNIYDYLTNELKVSPNIFEIAKERLKKVIKKIEAEYNIKNGFKILKTKEGEDVRKI